MKSHSFKVNVGAYETGVGDYEQALFVGSKMTSVILAISRLGLKKYVFR